jgi:hypothetical protein
MIAQAAPSPDDGEVRDLADEAEDQHEPHAEAEFAHEIDGEERRCEVHGELPACKIAQHLPEVPVAQRPGQQPPDRESGGLRSPPSAYRPASW